MSQTHLKSFRDHEWDLFQSISGVYYLYLGLRRAPKPYFGLILEVWIIFLIFCEWIILLNILDYIEWIFFWMNIPDFVLKWTILRPDSMKKWIFKTDRPGLPVLLRTNEIFLSNMFPLQQNRGQMRVAVCVKYLQIWNIHRASFDCEPDRLPPHLMIRVSAHCHQGGRCDLSCR